MQEYIEHYDDGSVKVRGKKQGSLKVGIWSFFKKNGLKVMEAHFSNQGEPLFNFYFDNRGSIIEQGFVVVPYPDGQPSEEGLVKNCLKQGTWNFYDNSGNKRAIGEYKNGLKQGPWKYYDQFGNLECAGTFHKNRWHGTVAIYNNDGSIKQQRKYVHGDIVASTPA